MTKILFRFMLLCSSFFLAFVMHACNNNQQVNNEENVATATITGTMPDTAVTGMARFTESGNKVKMVLQLTIPSKANQSVAVHIHEKGNCGDTGKAAGDHWNPTHASHGKWEGNSFHAGDIGNVSLDANGKGNKELETDLWSIEGKPETNILDKSVIVHGGTDDYTSQPGGNSGGRIGCGIISKAEK
jgi:Cu-Zn family superoxide dismutase